MAAAAGGEQIYATLLLGDSYLPGALVLAHSLRDGGTKRRLACLATLDSVSADAVTELKKVYDFVISVPRIRNDNPANLYLMNRGDLHSAFTKVNLWKQMQFTKIVYIDADVVAYRAPDELFDLSHAFSAAPDIGWPDLFNTGVMVLTPSMGEYYAMMAMAERGISFDGADQGLINMHFRQNYNRLSFTYNVTPSAHYQYVPAYRHFQSSINMVHFIGTEKPWFTGRNGSHGSSPFDEMTGRWWAVYDRHYRAQSNAPPTYSPSAGIVQYYVKGEFQPREAYSGPNQAQSSQSRSQTENTIVEEPSANVAGRLASHASTSQPEERQDDQVSDTSQPDTHAVKAQQEEPQSFTQSWDAQRQPPPADSKPEALDFPQTHYEMSRDTKPFVPPERYPSPPRNMWYDVPKQPPAPPAVKPKPIFPWEGQQPTPTRFFAGGPTQTLEPAAEIMPGQPDASATGSSTVSAPTRATRVWPEDGPPTPATPTIGVIGSDPWTSFARVNAWDDVPEIGRYVEGLQQHRRGKNPGSRPSNPTAAAPTPPPAVEKAAMRQRGIKLTDFPTEVERPSLPVTPAPVHRKFSWTGDSGEPETDEAGQPLPAAEGVPAQPDWDPVAQLQKLAQQQSEILLRKLGGEEGVQSGVLRDIPQRPLPYGSEDVRSPTFEQTNHPEVISPRPLKGDTTSSVRNFQSLPTTVSALQPAPGAVDEGVMSVQSTTAKVTFDGDA